MTCLACGASDARTNLGSPWCISHFCLPLDERYSLFLQRCEQDYQQAESEAVEGYEREAAA